jgi:hypothetical protein
VGEYVAAMLGVTFDDLLTHIAAARALD